MAGHPRPLLAAGVAGGRPSASTGSSPPYASDSSAVFAGAVPFLKLMGIVCGGWQMARAALAAQQELAAGKEGDAAFLKAKITTARFFADHLLAQAPGLARTIVPPARRR